ncbi:MAG TPA: hypothetical protein DCE41_11015 [Cytophagales bacterium]|nr:hypothetical protein [Cytophagales bacterium]HAP64649.1 hypothetical protein [Cytophagales bacterium]
MKNSNVAPTDSSTKSIWRELALVNITEPATQFRKSIGEFVRLWRTSVQNFLHPGKLIFEEVPEGRYLDPVRASRATLKLLFVFIAFHVLFKISDYSEPLVQVAQEFSALLIFLVSILLVVVLCYIINLLGDFKLTGTNTTAHLFLSQFNLIYFGAAIFTAFKVSPMTGLYILVPLSWVVIVYHFVAYRKYLKYHTYALVLGAVAMMVLMTMILIVDLLVTSSINTFQELVDTVFEFVQGLVERYT